MTSREPATSREATELGQLVGLIATGAGASRADLARTTSLSRSTISQRIDLLLDRGLVVETGDGPSTGGRRPVILSLNPDAGVVLGADLGASHYELEVTDLGGKVLAGAEGSSDIAAGPETVLGMVDERFTELLAQVERGPQHVRAIGIGVPGPVEFATGTVVRPPIMPGWDGFVVPDWFQGRYEGPVLVDNDVNVMALGVYWSKEVDSEQLLVVKVGTGIGCGIISRGTLHRGADGAAGDIGHIRIPGEGDAICTCGNSGCLEAVASGSAIAARLRREGVHVSEPRDLVDLARTGEPRVLREVRSAGLHIGEVLASLVNFYNPDTIIIGGSLAELRDELLAAIRSVIYERALPLATHRLRIMTAAPGQHTAVAGAALLARQEALSVAAIGRWFAHGASAVATGAPHRLPS